MLISTLIAQLRREYNDEPKSVTLSRQGNGNINIFNTGKFPIIENSYTVYVSGIVKTDLTDYDFDLDNGDLQITSTPGNGIIVKADLKYAEWRDKNWMEAIAQSVETLNARGFFRQVVRFSKGISANVQSYSGPSACVDIYELLVSDNSTVSGNFKKPQVNWSYQQDANKLVLGNKPSTANKALISYLRNLQTPSATTMTLDTLNDWNELVKKKAGALFFRSLAGKIAKQGNASIDEGHFSFTNLRTMANDLDAEFERLAARKKPTRPAKDIGFVLSNGGVA